MLNVKRMPSGFENLPLALVLVFLAPASEAAMSFALRKPRGEGGGFRSDEAAELSDNGRPVITSQLRRITRDRHRIVRPTRAGRECQVRTSVPMRRTVRSVVTMKSGGSVSAYQIGISINIRINMAVKAGRVVADVAVL